MQRGKAKKQKRRLRPQARGRGPGGGGLCRKWSWAPGLRHKASSLLAAASGRARCKHVQRRLPGGGARARQGGDGQPGAPTAASTAVQPGLMVTIVPWPRQLEKREVRLRKLGWLTWCSLGITTHALPRGGPEIHSVSPGSHFLLWGNLCRCVSPAIPGTSVRSAAAAEVIHY